MFCCDLVLHFAISNISLQPRFAFFASAPSPSHACGCRAAMAVHCIKPTFVLWRVLYCECFTRLQNNASSIKCILHKKAVLSPRWPHDARYISRSWAVAEIWSFEIIQDGGGRHLEFVRIENSGISSAVPEKPTPEQNMKWIGRPVVEI